MGLEILPVTSSASKMTVIKSLVCQMMEMLLPPEVVYPQRMLETFV